MLKALSLLPLTPIFATVPATELTTSATESRTTVPIVSPAAQRPFAGDESIQAFTGSLPLEIAALTEGSSSGRVRPTALRSDRGDRGLAQVPAAENRSIDVANRSERRSPNHSPNPAVSRPATVQDLIALPDPGELPTTPTRLDVTRSQSVRPLPGQLDQIPVFNSNSPELIQKSGILLSTFPGDGMQVPNAHLNYPMQGRFDVFAHHVAKGLNRNDVRTMYLGIVIYNPSERPVKVDVLQGVTYLSQEAPFNDLPSYVANPMGTVFAGPGSRVMGDILRGQSQPQWTNQINIPGKSAQLLVNVPIPLRRLTVAVDGTLPPGSIIPGLPVAAAQLNIANAIAAANPALGTVALAANRTADQTPPPAVPPRVVPTASNDPALPINGRTILMRMSSNGPVYLASLAMYAPMTDKGEERVPTLAEWIQLLRTSDVSGPRDRQPTPPNTRFAPRFFYGRVSGVAQGSEWIARPTDKEGVDHLSIPDAGEAISYVISSVDRNTFGTGQIQSAPMLVRYPDTAYRAHGNYGVLYNITLPLRNNTDSTQRVAILMQTPLQDERLEGEGLRFRNPPYDQVFFRGTVRIRFTDDLGIRQTRYMHVVQRRGQQGEPLIRMTLPKGAQRTVEVQLIYPPDSTPPQVLTIETQPYNGLAAEPHESTQGS